MAFTMQQVVDAARIPLNDKDKVRFEDSELLGYANDGILRIRQRRPDLFLGRWFSLPGSLALTDIFPLHDELKPALADYVTARAEFKDDEFSENGRAAASLALFERAVG